MARYQNLTFLLITLACLTAACSPLGLDPYADPGAAADFVCEPWYEAVSGSIELPVENLTEAEVQVTLEVDLATDAAVYALYAQDGTFLGDVDFDLLGGDSLCNPLSVYATTYQSVSIFNPYGPYGSELDSLSAFNTEATSPPVLFRDDDAWVYMTANPQACPRLDSEYLVALLEEYGCEVER